MNTLVLILKPAPHDQEATCAALRELHAWASEKTDIVYYHLDYQAFKHVAAEMSELWPIRLNLFNAPQGAAQAVTMLAHIAIKMNSDVYHIGEDTAVTQVFENMGIEVSNLPVE